MDRDSFIIYKSFYKPISKLSDKQLGRLFRTIFMYQLGEVVTVEEDIEMAFEFFKNQFEIDESKYQGIVERNRENGRKGGAYGKLGGRPRKDKGQMENPQKPRTGLKNLLNDNDNDNESSYEDIKKESPIGDKKEAEASSPSPPHPDFARFNDWLKQNAPFCNDPKNFPSQITEEEFKRLKSKYTSAQIAEIILQIENRRDLRKRYTNLYRTVLNWAKRDYGSSGGFPDDNLSAEGKRKEVLYV